jgi:SAM-dependent methyltransferase
MADWGTGEYERTAEELAPAAARAVELARVRTGERVLDLGTGTGNAALLAARAGADVTAADPSPRLLGVARERMAAEGLGGTFAQAGAEELPFGDGAFDLVLSVFAVIFAEDPERAACEIVRVLAPGGRAVITTWQSSGPVHDAVGVLAKAVADVSPDPPTERFAWGDPDVVAALFERAGARTDVQHGELLEIEAASPEAYVERFESAHPLGMFFRDVLTRAGTYDEVRAGSMAVLERANEAGTGLRVRSGYLVFTITAG